MQHPRNLIRSLAGDAWHNNFTNWLRRDPYPSHRPVEGLAWYGALKTWLADNPYPDLPAPPPPVPPAPPPVPTPTPPQWPSFKGTSLFVGTNGATTVWVDPLLGPQALQNANDLLGDAPRVVSANNGFFGTSGGHVDVIVFALGGLTDGTGGADHMGCDYTSGAAIEVCASFGNSSRVSALFEAELSECSMGGNLCGVSTGESLSRWCALSTSNNALSDFATAPIWAHDGMPNWIDSVDPTDRDADSIGCGMAFISWMLHNGHPLNVIAQALVSLGSNGTWAQLYSNLTGTIANNAWPAFISAVDVLPGGVQSDTPFGVS